MGLCMSKMGKSPVVTVQRRVVQTANEVRKTPVVAVQRRTTPSANDVREVYNQTQAEIRTSYDNCQVNKEKHGIRGSYQSDAQKIATVRSYYYSSSSLDNVLYNVETNEDSPFLYYVPVNAGVNRVDFQVQPDNSYTLGFISSLREDGNNETTSEELNPATRERTFTAPLIAVDIYKNGAADLTTYDCQGNEIKKYHKNESNQWDA